MGELKDWAQKGSRFIKLGDGESFEAAYAGHKFTEFNGKPTIEYSFIMGDEEKILTTSNRKFAVQMDDVKTGQTVEIVRFGLGKETMYKCRIKDQVEKPQYLKEIEERHTKTQEELEKEWQ